jgi:hypothetical protein
LPVLELPDDPSVDALPGALRDAIGRHWALRAAAELGVARAFVALRPRLADVGAVPVVLALADKAIDDEQRHGELCARLAGRYLGAAVTLPAPRFDGMPDFGSGDEPLEVALTVLGSCCINESIAASWLRACFSASTSPVARAANKHHLADEIDHARLGWAHFASRAVTDDLRRRLRPFLARSLEVNVAAWREPDPCLPLEGVPEHGHLGAEAHRRAIAEGVDEVVLPGLAEVGLRLPSPA